MPFEIRESSELLYVRFFGVVSNEDLQRQGMEIERLEARIGRPINRFIDMIDVDTIDAGYSEVWRYVSRRLALKYSGPFKCAFIAPRPMLFGYARMFQMLNDNPQLEIRIFDTIEEARRWFNAG